jgi:signal peptidase I
VNDPYHVLGVSRDATSREISDAYWQLRRDNDVDSPWASDRLREIEQAYRVLSDPVERAAYDAGRGDGLRTLAGAPPADGTVPAVGEAGDPAPERQAGLPPPLVWDVPSTPGEPWPERTGTYAPPPPPPPSEPPHHSRNPIDRLTRRLPRPWRIAADWVLTIVGAVAIVLGIKAWIVNPYRIPSSSMEPTLHCARPGSGCLSRFSDRVLANRFIYHFRKPHRGDIIVFKTPPQAKERCGAGGTFVKRLIGLPGETIEERLIRGRGYIFINGARLKEPYVEPQRRDSGTYGPFKIPPGRYFFMGDNRNQSCDSREWGPVPRDNLIGQVFFIYWPPNRIGFAALTVAALGLLPIGLLHRRRRSS